MTTRIDKLSYHQEQMIGQGRFGTAVFSGFYYEDEDDDKKKQSVAVKRIQRIYVKDNRSTVEHEVELMQKAGNHPNVLRYIFFEMDTNFLYLATELCGGTLEDLFFNGKYDGLEKKIISEIGILRQVTRGLAHLHKLGIVHRDIKPENILFIVSSSVEETDSTEPSKPSVVMKLADFDIAKILKTERKDFTNTSLTSPNGTRGWMPPELFIKELFDFKVDVWALGCIFAYTLSGGKHPFGDDIKRVIRIMEKEPMVLGQKDLKEPYSEDPSIFALIKSMVSTEPDNRPSVTEVLKSSFLKDKNRTSQFVALFKSFLIESKADDSIIRIKELMKDETVDVNALSWTSHRYMSPLHLVCHHYFDYEELKFAKDYKGVELVRDLLLHGANVNARATHVKNASWWFEQTGLTPLHLLFGSAKAKYVVNQDDFIDIVQLLLEKGADINAKTVHGETPLDYLCTYYQGDELPVVAELLIKNGADVNAKDRSQEKTPLQTLCYNYKNENLIHALKLLIKKGAHANTKDTFGDNPLYTVCSNYGEKNMLDIVKLLIDNGADVNNNVSWIQRRFQRKQRSPLNSLCKFYHHDNLIDIVQLLIQKGADVNARGTLDNVFVPSLELVAVREDYDPYRFGNTLLHYLCLNYSRNQSMSEIIQLIIQKGAHVNAKNVYGNTPLHYLCYNYRKIEVIKKDNVMGLIDFFVEKGAQMNEKNENGSTPTEILKGIEKTGAILQDLRFLFSNFCY